MSTTPPNLFVIMVDQMQAQLLDQEIDACPVPLPNLRKLASTSTQLTRTYCPAPICTPTRASFQLGVPVWQHGVLGNDRNMPANLPTLPERLVKQGYTTSYVGKWHLDVTNQRGWQHHSLGNRNNGHDHGYFVMGGINAPHQGSADYADQDHLDGTVYTESLSELHRLQSQNQPWALMTSFYGPHAPYYIPKRWHDLINPESIDLPDDFDAPFENKPAIQSDFRCRAWGQTWRKDKWQRIRAAYWGYTAMLDDFVGKLISKVDQANTAIVFLSDHGEMNGHQKMIYKGPMMYEQLVHVPSIIHLPGQTQAKTDVRLWQTQDITAALLRLAGDNKHASTLPTHDLLNEAQTGRDVVTSEFHEANWVKPVVEQRVAMLREKQYKYVFTEAQQCELYDMEAALPEVENLAVNPAFQARVNAMHARLCDLIPWVKDAAKQG
ncbi:MAG: sulfatase-like hydrolase/transferase [Phycisphaeraceae bacterium JB051]